MAQVYETGTTGYHKTYEPAGIYNYKVSWGAIFAGTFVALGLQLALTLLGIGIGVGLIGPATETSLGAVSVGAGIWMAITMLISLFAGGWVAGRFSGVYGTLRNALHGVVVWSFFVLSVFYVMTTAAGSLVSSFANIIGRGTSIIVGEVPNISPEMMEAASNTLPTASIWMFVALLLGAGAAALGGWLGRSREIPAVISAEEERKKAA